MVDQIIEKPEWTYTHCLRCKKTLWGSDDGYRWRGQGEFICPYCGVINIFDNSIEPVEMR